MNTTLKTNGKYSLIEVDNPDVSVYYIIIGFENGLTERFYKYNQALNRYETLISNTNGTSN